MVGKQILCTQNLLEKSYAGTYPTGTHATVETKKQVCCPKGKINFEATRKVLENLVTRSKGHSSKQISSYFTMSKHDVENKEKLHRTKEDAMQYLNTENWGQFALFLEFFGDIRNFSLSQSNTNMPC